MVNIAYPATQWAFLILVSVVMGTCLLIAVAFFRRWQQIRYARYVHNLQRTYRPVLTKLLSGVRSPAGIGALRELGLADLEILFDPIFSKRKVTERSLVFLQALCAKLGLVELWQRRSANGHAMVLPSSRPREQKKIADGASMRFLLRAKSIRNLGTLRHQPSWPLLVKALDDRHADIQLVALRSLAALAAPESFPVLRDRLHAVVLAESTSPPLRALHVAMASFAIGCIPALLPSLRHPHRQIRLRATEILRTIVYRESARRPHGDRTPELLAPPMVDSLLAGLAVDASGEIRARAAEVIVFLDDARTTPVMRNLLLDPQWFVRLRAVQALAYAPQAANPLHPDIQGCLRDPDWRVREAAIQTLISLGPEGKHRLYEYFLSSPDPATREQIVEVIERTGLMSALVQEYSAGAHGVDALMVEQLANDAAPLGLSGVLRTLNSDIRQRFLDRFIPHAQTKRMTLPEERPQEAERADTLQRALDFPPFLAA